MGDRGADNEDATESDIAEMGRLVAEAVDAGAVGFSTSRTIGHRALWGKPVPGTFAPFEELRAICAAMVSTGKGVFEMIPSGTVGQLERLGGEPFTLQEEHGLMARVSKETGCRVTFTLVQSPDDLAALQKVSPKPLYLIHTVRGPFLHEATPQPTVPLHHQLDHFTANWTSPTVPPPRVHLTPHPL